MEKKILQKICPGVPIRRIGCNGSDVPMAVMADFIETLIRLLNNRNHPILIIFDREGRVATCDDLISELSAELESRELNVDYRIGIPDQSIENWILADYDMLAEGYGVSTRAQNFEGTPGKSRLAALLRNRYKYHETTLGVEMFLKCDPQKMYRESTSFRKFAGLIDFDCYWLRDIHPIS